MSKLKVAVLGATGMVGQQFVRLLESHPFFEVVCLAASPRSAGKSYKEAVKGSLPEGIPQKAENMRILDVTADIQKIARAVDFCFCAVNMPNGIKALEEAYARLECPVISNNSAHRETADVPMVIPEINPEHLEVISSQKRRLNTKRGFIAVKSNCSLQSYLPLLHPLKIFGIKSVAVTTFQAISGAGKTYETFPEICDNIIPYISGEEAKSEKEPLKIWGKVENGEIVNATAPKISAQCLRVPVSNGHTAACSVSFENTPTKEQILKAWKEFSGEPQELALPSAPKQLIHYFEGDDRPQPKLDAKLEKGMAISVGRLRDDSVFDYKFIGLSHNVIRGAAGGAILLAELLYSKGYFER